LDDNSPVMLTVLINGQEVLSAGLLWRYAKTAVNYALESIRIQRMDDAQRQMEAENSVALAAAAEPILLAQAQFNERVTAMEQPGE